MKMSKYVIEKGLLEDIVRNLIIILSMYSETDVRFKILEINNLLVRIEKTYQDNEARMRHD